MDQNLLLLLTCTRGFENFAKDEAEKLGCTDLEVIGGGVRAKAPFDTVMKLCLWARTINKVMVEIAHTYVTKEADLYDMGKNVTLDPWFSAMSTFCIHAHINDERFKNPVILSLKVKDGIADKMREAWGCRASVDTQHPDIELNLQVIRKTARLYVEMQGEPLNMRGYRRRQNMAPIRETLAAAMIMASGWEPSTPFFDPMCGSGTFSIEAALMATNTAPGIQRHFGFEKLPFFVGEYKARWAEMRDQARDLAKTGRKAFAGQIFASDIDDDALDIAANNAKTAGLDQFITFSNQDVLKLEPSSGCYLMNPPYGDRLEVSGYELPEFYFQLGRKLRTFAGARLTIISTPELLKKNMHMKPETRIATFNGPIECEVATYTLGGATPRTAAVDAKSANANSRK